MFTVLIAEKEHIDAIQQENKLFFEPFLDNKDLAFCSWNPAGENLKDSLPGLHDIVGRKKEWRAVIINNYTCETAKQRNPFDVVEHSVLDSLKPPSQQPQQDEPIDKWESAWQDYYNALSQEKENVYTSALEKPLQKLSTWLCFKPEDYIYNEVQESQDAHDWAMEMLGRDDIKSSVRLEIFEREQYKWELRLKEKLRRDFVGENYLNINYPSEIYCISPRSSENNFFDPDAFWKVHQDSQYSSFSDRNMYFDKMRFMVFDMLSPTHRDYRSDYVRFLASVLILTSNPVPGSAMQSRRLYHMEVESNDEPLCTLVTSYDKKLSDTYDAIENEMERIKAETPGELTDKVASELFCTPKDVTVIMDDSCDPDQALAETDYGLFFDSPTNERYKWNNSYNVSKNALTYIAKQQSRSVRKSVKHMHLSSEVSDVNISRLTSFQIEDVRDYTNAAEDKMVASTPADLTDITKYTERLDEASDTVKKTIARRMTKKTGIILTSICMGLFLICFLPFLFANNGTSRTISTAVILILVSLGLLAAVLVVALLIMRSRVVDAVNGYNDTARSVINDIRAAMNQFSVYLSASCNVRRGHSVQNYARKNSSEYTKGLRIRKKHQDDIRLKRAHLEEHYSDYLGNRSYIDETMSRPYEYDFDQATEYEYPAPFLAGDYRQIEFVSSGNFVTVPSSFITRILVRMEGIYEK